ncbi:MAG: ABC transporter ATP-binding protein [Candidatus Sericytochromatia bacterium]|uniref:ABC transporter ATP-binding protein n=1 Tax=Candidatus Tanganyikabacteria bacterium TaxID=2961651 RepID=A0A937X1S9_9BACT|nr:ABC transporter ATP-binding protein [Candidatus Tanganyikabacteria bacterium]
MALLEIKGLNAHYGKIHALRGIDLAVREGEIVTLIGANGAGKSTTLRAISGMIAPQGVLNFQGTSLVGKRPAEITALGVVQVPEGRRIFSRLTVLENLELGAYLRRDKDGIKADIEAQFARFPVLGQRKTQLAGTLSGGEQQMLAIGRALMTRPKLLLLDEPSMGLAPLIVRQIMSIIVEINKQGIPVLLVEQNAKQALAIANRGYVLETGAIRLEGSGQGLMESEEVKHAYLGG